MKHAILITAYTDFQQLEKLINQFDENYNIYIHIDKKSKITPERIQRLSENRNVKYLSRKYKVNWGGFNHLKSYLLLSEEALNNKENEYFHLITGQDFPIKDNQYFDKLLLSETDQKSNYLDYFKMPTSRWFNGGMHRLEFYNLYDLINAKTEPGRRLINFILKVQKKINIRRPIKFAEQLYGGSTYWTLHRNCLQYVINFTKKNPDFYKRFKYTFCAEEIYFQTIIMNSEHSKNVINDNLRFIIWDNRKGGNPAFLNENDYEAIIKSNKLFARKINSSNDVLTRKILIHKDSPNNKKVEKTII